MRYKKFWVLAAVVMALFMIVACGKKKPDKPEFGTVEDGIYKNKYFGMTATIPEGWHVAGRESIKKMQDQAKEITAGDDEGLKATLDAAELTSVQLLSIFKHPPGTPVDFNPNLQATAEKVDLPGVKKGRDYLFHAKNLMKRNQIPFEFPNEIYSKNIGGVEFDVLEAEIRAGNLVVYQKYFAVMAKGYALSMVISFASDEGEAELTDFLNTFQFDFD